VKKQRLYLDDLLERIRRIEVTTSSGRNEFMASFVIQDAVIRSFEVIGEIVKRLPPERLTAYPDIPWRQIAGFRDVLIHDYEKVDLEAVWQVVEEDLGSLKQAVEGLLSSLGDDE
jgi:uncharacterized protein with HEPN domain